MKNASARACEAAAYLRRVEEEAAAKKAEEEKARKRAEQDARFPLPAPYEWRRQEALLYAYNLEDGSALYVDSGSKLCYEEEEGTPADECTFQPLDVVRAVIARYDAENAPEESWDISEVPLHDQKHPLKVGDKVRLLHTNGKESVHTVSAVLRGGVVGVTPHCGERDYQDAVGRVNGIVKVTKLTK